MAQAKKLTEDEIQSKLATLAGWTLTNGKLHKTFKFKSFVEAFGFMTSVAIVAEAMQHHPEWLNVYNNVTVDLVTHDVGGISENDFVLAKKMDELAR